MNLSPARLLLLACALSLAFFAAAAQAQDRAATKSGTVQGSISADGHIHVFKGIPYAAPPVGDLRWQPPHPAHPWTGVRNATQFGARCMQARIYDDMVFRDSGPSEDCLYLNVWTPSLTSSAKLPVMVWIYGGGYQAGATSEPRQDGENLARRGVVIVSMNYRLGIFGFFSYPGLVKESSHHAAGNYGLLDQAAALQWVHDNISSFGGDPSNVTIFGESAGSFSVSALMASPLSRGLIHRAIGESGAFFGRTLGLKPVSETSKDGEKFAASLGAKSLKDLRSIPAKQLLDDVMKEKGKFRFVPNFDGYFFPKPPAEIYAQGEQAHIPLLAGWNHDEGTYQDFFGKDPVTAENYLAKLRERFGVHSGEVLQLFPGSTAAEARQSAGQLSGAQFIALGTWKWLELQLRTGHSPVYRYEFDQALPLTAEARAKGAEPLAYHSSEIEFVFGTLDSKPLPWRSEDHLLSQEMGAYWTNFAKTADPNGPGLPHWPQYDSKDGYQLMRLDAPSKAGPDRQRAQFLLLDRLAGQPN